MLDELFLYPHLPYVVDFEDIEIFNPLLAQSLPTNILETTFLIKNALLELAERMRIVFPQTLFDKFEVSLLTMPEDRNQKKSHSAVPYNGEFFSIKGLIINISKSNKSKQVKISISENPDDVSDTLTKVYADEYLLNGVNKFDYVEIVAYKELLPLKRNRLATINYRSILRTISHNSVYFSDKLDNWIEILFKHFPENKRALIEISKKAFEVTNYETFVFDKRGISDLILILTLCRYYINLEKIGDYWDFSERKSNYTINELKSECKKMREKMKKCKVTESLELIDYEYNIPSLYPKIEPMLDHMQKKLLDKFPCDKELVLHAIAKTKMTINRRVVPIKDILFSTDAILLFWLHHLIKEKDKEKEEKRKYSEFFSTEYGEEHKKLRNFVSSLHSYIEKSDLLQ
ncbi:hypothetical protein ES705_34400 [subsurface metagenome]